MLVLDCPSNRWKGASSPIWLPVGPRISHQFHYQSKYFPRDPSTFSGTVMCSALLCRFGGSSRSEVRYENGSLGSTSGCSPSDVRCLIIHHGPTKARRAPDRAPSPPPWHNAKPRGEAHVPWPRQEPRPRSRENNLTDRTQTRPVWDRKILQIAAVVVEYGLNKYGVLN